MLDIVTILEQKGQEQAFFLRENAKNLDDTAIIDKEQDIPFFEEGKDYSSWPYNAPVKSEEQVWKLLQPYNSAIYKGLPSSYRNLWSLCHTKNPEKAKPWVAPYGTSGMYMKDECYLDARNQVWRAKQDNLVYNAVEVPTNWEKVNFGGSSNG